MKIQNMLHVKRKCTFTIIWVWNLDEFKQNTNTQTERNTFIEVKEKRGAKLMLVLTKKIDRFVSNDQLIENNPIFLIISSEHNKTKLDHSHLIDLFFFLFIFEI